MRDALTLVQRIDAALERLAPEHNTSRTIAERLHALAAAGLLDPALVPPAIDAYQRARYAAPGTVVEESALDSVARAIEALGNDGRAETRAAARAALGTRVVPPAPAPALPAARIPADVPSTRGIPPAARWIAAICLFAGAVVLLRTYFSPAPPRSVPAEPVARPGLFSSHLELPHRAADSWGISAADVDADGSTDLFVCTIQGGHLFRAKRAASGLTLEDVTAAAGLGGDHCRCPSWADADADGTLELFLSNQLAPPMLWKREGERFRDVSDRLPALPAHNAEGAGWMDVDDDGAPDIVLTNGEHGIAVLANDRKGRFRDVSTAVGLGAGKPGAENGDYLAAADVDGDGAPDFLYNMQSGGLFRNGRARGFRHDGSGIAVEGGQDFKHGAAFGDRDGDGDMDLFVPQRNGGRLFDNDGKGRFTLVAPPGLSLEGTPRSSVWGDFDRDGTLDLVVGFGDRPVELFVQSTAGGFQRATRTGLEQTRTAGATGMLSLDADGDGDLDLVVNVGSDRTLVLLSGAVLPSGRATLRAVLPRTTAPGTSITVMRSERSIAGSDQVGLPQNFCSQGPPEALFHLAPGSYVAVARFPGGKRVERAFTLAPHATVDVHFTP